MINREKNTGCNKNEWDIFLMRIVKSFFLSLVVFIISIFLFKSVSTNIFSVLIYPAASSVICTLVVLKLARSAAVAYISLVLNNLLLFLGLIPLAAGSQLYLTNLKIFFSPENNYHYAVFMIFFVLASLLMCYLTIKLTVSLHRSGRVFISKKHLNRYFQE